MKALLENIDLFAHKINFNYGKKNLYHSFFGISLSFYVYGLMMFFVYYFSKDYFKGTNPKLVYKETEFDSNGTLKLDQIIDSDFKCNLAIISTEPLFNLTKKNSSSEIVSGDLIKIHIEHKPFSRAIESTLILLNTKTIVKLVNSKYPCGMGECYKYEIDIFSFENFTVNLYKDLVYLQEDDLPQQITEYKNINLTLQAGDVLDIGIAPLEMLIDLIESENTLKYYVSNDFYIKNHIINVNSESFFKSYRIDGRFWGKTESKEKPIEMPYSKYNFGMVKLIDDKGFIFSEELVPKYALKLNYESKGKKLEHLSKNFPYNLVQIEIDKLLKQYERIYKKLQNILADLGGIFNSLVLIGNIIIVQFNKMKFDYDLINKVFKIEKEDELKNSLIKEIDSPKSKIIQNVNNNNASIIEMSSSRSFTRNFTAETPIVNINHRKIKNEFPDNHIKKHISIRDDDKKEFENPLKDSISLNNHNKNDLINVKKEKNKVEYVFREKCKYQNQNLEKLHAPKDVKEFLEQFKKDELLKKPLKLSKSNFFSFFICCRKLKDKDLIEKEKIFQLAQSEIYEYMDIVNYVLLFEKTNKLISIIFDESQSYSFNFIHNRKLNEITNQRVNEENTKKVVDYYKHKIRDSKMTLYDKRMMKNFYSSFKDLIIGN